MKTNKTYWTCNVCGKGTPSEDGNRVPVFRNGDSNNSFVHTECFPQLDKSFHVGHHNVIKKSGQGFLVFWRGMCAEVKKLSIARNELRWHNENSTANGRNS